VLCHGDLIGDNLLRDRGRRLWLVDWDGATLAPRERDLALFAGQRFERFLADYERVADYRRFDLDPDLVAFFLLRRNLDDLVDWLGAVLGNDRPDEQRRGDLDGSGGACRAGTSWRGASHTPAWCWHGGDAVTDANAWPMPGQPSPASRCAAGPHGAPAGRPVQTRLTPHTLGQILVPAMVAMLYLQVEVVAAPRSAATAGRKGPLPGDAGP